MSSNHANAREIDPTMPADDHQPLQPAPAQAEADKAPVPRWAIHRRLYDWTLSLAHTKHATWALFLISFAESSFFPIPPDVLLAPLCMSHRKRALWFATVTTAASILGAVLGYIIGMQLIDLAIMIPGIEMGADTEPAKGTINWLSDKFNTNGSTWVFIAALTPIPFKLLTITAGFTKMNLGLFLGACVVGRSLRFYGVAGLFWWIGPKAQPLIDKYFNWLCLIFVVLLVGGFAILKLI